MKTIIIIAALMLIAAGKGVAADPLSDFSKSITKPQTGAQFVNPFTPAKGIQKYKIDRLGKISSLPWTQIVARENMGSSAFYDAISTRPQMPLFWIGAEPQP